MQKIHIPGTVYVEYLDTEISQPARVQHEFEMKQMFLVHLLCALHWGTCVISLNSCSPL